MKFASTTNQRAAFGAASLCVRIAYPSVPLLARRRDAMTSHRSRSKASSSAVSLLSSTNLDLVLDMIDSHYRAPKPGRSATVAFDSGQNPADLLGNLGPPGGNLGRSCVPIANTVPERRQPTTAFRVPMAVKQGDRPHGGGRQPQASEVDVIIVRALGVAKADGKRLEELLSVLEKVTDKARASPATTPQQLQQLEQEVRDTRHQLRQMLKELNEIQKSFVAETFVHVGALAPKLSALAHWQDTVIHNPLVARARQHTEDGSLASLRTTAQQFLNNPMAHQPQTGAPPVQATPAASWSFSAHRR